MLIENYDQLSPFISSIQASYVWLYNSFDVMLRNNKIPSIGSLDDVKPKNQVRIEIDEYVEKLTWEATRENLDLNTYNMKKYIDGPIKVNTMLLMLQNEVDTGSKTIYLDAMEARIRL